MSSLLTDEGLKIDQFDALVAAALGSSRPPGGNLIAVAVELGRGRVELRDWFYCLLRASGTLLRRHFIDNPGQSPDRLIPLLEDGCDAGETTQGALLSTVTRATVAPDAIEMLIKAEAARKTREAKLVSDQILTEALWAAAEGNILKDLLKTWLSEPGVKRFEADLRPRPKEVAPLFRAQDGVLDRTLFDKGGRALCARLLEDAASLAATKISTRHLLYSLLGEESGALHVGLALQGLDVKRDLHARLARELSRGVRKRNDALALNKECLFDAVVSVLTEAQALAARRGATRVAEADVASAFLAKQTAELHRLLGDDKKVDLTAVREFVALRQEDPPEEEDDHTLLPVAEIALKIKARILGQDAAVDSIIPWIKRFRFGLRREGRPAGVFLFLGPTGTGKTQLAKELARYVFGDPERMIFIEMGQFKTKESMNNLVGASPGYVGYGEGKLTNGLRDMPECVVLFDEIEKADTQVFDTILRFADEGLISDPAGPIRDGRRCIIVMTTNAGQAALRDRLQPDRQVVAMKAGPQTIGTPDGTSDEAVAATVGSPEPAEVWRSDDPDLAMWLFEAADKELRQHGFRPEFLGRVDQRVTFLPFSRETCRGIVDQVLAGEVKQFAERGVEIKVEDEVCQVLAELAHKRSLDEGARGVPRAINEHIIAPAIDQVTAQPDDAGRFAVGYLRFFQDGSGAIRCGAEP